ncbi:MAG: hypothetical protein R3D61_11420 [Defluviimonas denitrificans]
MSIEQAERRRASALVAPALLWTLAFFVLPFAGMVWLSLGHLEGREVVAGPGPENYVRIFTDPSFLKGIRVSLEITLVVTGRRRHAGVDHRYGGAAALVVLPALMLAVLPFWTSMFVRSHSPGAGPWRERQTQALIGRSSTNPCRSWRQERPR